MATAPDRYQPAARGFRLHVEHAIASNTQRRSYYASVSGGASLPVSDRLIRAERMVLPLAMYFDARARHFNREGIGVVQGDFVPMSGILPPQTPPRYRGLATPDDVQQLKGWLKTYRQESDRALDKRDFATVASLTDQMLGRIEHLEETSQSHFAMTKHLVESVGYAALHAETYHDQSRGASDAMAAHFTGIQAFALQDGVSLDVQAQPLQQRGIGILVNDLPHIPFREEYARTRAPGA